MFLLVSPVLARPVALSGLEECATRALSNWCRCGEDGRVFHYDMRAPNARHSLLVCNKNVGATGGRVSLV